MSLIMIKKNKKNEEKVFAHGEGEFSRKSKFNMLVWLHLLKFFVLSKLLSAHWN